MSAISNFSFENFREEILKKGVARPNRFEVSIMKPPCLLLNEDIEMDDVKMTGMLVEWTQLPQTRLVTSRQQIFGPPSFHPQGIEYGGDNLTMQFYLDQNMSAKKFFDAWMNKIIDPEDFTVGYYYDILGSKMTITQLNEQDFSLYGVEFNNIFPAAVNPIQLDHNAGNTVSKLTVVFNYKTWNKIKPGDNNVELLLRDEYKKLQVKRNSY